MLAVLFAGLLESAGAHASTTSSQQMISSQPSTPTLPGPTSHASLPTITGRTKTPVSVGAATTVTPKVTPVTSVPGAHQSVSPPAPSVPPSPTKLYDSADPAGIPSNAPAVAGYVTGPYAWTPQEWAQFPHAAPITIDIVGGDKSAMVEDVEPGGVPVSDLRPWAQARIAQGYTPVIYSSLADRPAVAQQLQGLSWHWWAANPTGSPNLVYGSQATQWQWNGNSNDISRVPGGVAQLIH